MEQQKEEERKSRLWYYKDGKLFFRKEVERNVFFILTLIMLLGGILVKFGFF